MATSAFDDRSNSVCRDENCTIVEVHPPHLIRKIGKIKPHHRPKGDKPLWQRDDPKALTGAVARAVPKSYPTYLTPILQAVRDDYGTCSERTVYRHLRRLVERGHLVKVDLGLAFAGYIRPGSKLLDQPDGKDTMRDHLMALVECIPVTKRGL